MCGFLITDVAADDATSETSLAEFSQSSNVGCSTAGKPTINFIQHWVSLAEKRSREKTSLNESRSGCVKKRVTDDAFDDKWEKHLRNSQRN